MYNIQLDEVLLIAWFFVIGAVIGSFLNVVVYRLPKKMSLIEPSSHCPACKHPVRWFDNIPIVSWLVLRGRCRDCGAAFSPRYPLVELVSAGMFALLITTEFIHRGINLPLREIPRGNNVLLVTRNNWELYGIMLYHLLLLCTLLAAALIEIDRHRPPWRMFVPALLVGVIAPLLWPYLRPVPAWPGLSDFLGRAADGAAGLAAGGLLGYLAWRIQKSTSPSGLPWSLLCVGIFLGWQAVCLLAVAIMLIAFVFVAFSLWKKKKSTDWPFTLLLYAATMGWILTWSPLVNLVK